MPSLFSLSTADPSLKAMMGTVADRAMVSLPGTKIRTHGPLLITHWGVSGPAILKLSSHAARILHERQYKTKICINWTGLPEAEVRQQLMETAAAHPMQQLTTHAPLGMTQRLWTYLLAKSIGGKPEMRWNEMGKKVLNRLVAILTADEVAVTGRAPFRDEFVTCGGIALSNIHPQTMESRVRPGMYFAGEVLDIDGVTGGFNFQAAWTTAFTAASAIAQRAKALF